MVFPEERELAGLQDMQATVGRPVTALNKNNLRSPAFTDKVPV